MLVTSNTQKQPKTSLKESAHFEQVGRYFVFRPSLRRANLLISKQSLPFEAVCEEISTVNPGFSFLFFFFPFFFQVFAKNSLIKYIFEEKKKFDRRT